MHVHAVAGIFGVGFCHKRCGKSVLSRHATHQQFEQPRVVSGFHGVAVGQVDFELAKTRFRDCGFSGNVHRFGAVIKGGEVVIERIKRAQGQDFCTGAAFACAWAGHDLKVFAAVIHKVEFQFGAADRGQATICVAFQHRRQRVAWIAFKRAPVFAIHPHRQKCRRIIQPWHWQKSTFRWKTNTIWVACLKYQRRIVDVFAPDIEVQNR